MCHPARRSLCLALGALIVGTDGGRAPAAPLDQPIAHYAFKPSTRADEDLIVTPPGFAKPGTAARAEGPDAGHLTLVVKDGDTGKPTPCRVNVVGPDGQFYQPGENPLKAYSLTGVWP